ncbi:MAG: TPM domain-containing protein [Blastocatellia bacterium]|nr:TPM domain-containing protein [Blastocatellia bacterium]
MKARSFNFRTLFAVAALMLAASTAFSQATSPLPAPTGMVNDYAGVIDAATKESLETKLRQLKESTNPPVEIAVVVVKTTGDRPIFDYSLAIARGWGIGTKEDDNPSALLLVAIDDRKYFTQVSKDLEDELPDGVVGSLQRQFLVPEFRKANYSKGISDTVDAYIQTIRNKGNTAGRANTSRPSSDSGNVGSTALCGVFICALIIFVIILIIVSRGSKGGPSSKDRSRWGGGGFGSSGDSGASALPWIVGGVLGSGGGSSSSDWGGSSGGSDWGGFGGGGDFGGGGAGGDW